MLGNHQQQLIKESQVWSQPSAFAKVPQMRVGIDDSSRNGDCACESHSYTNL